jgi:hypothetical protein
MSLCAALNQRINNFGREQIQFAISGGGHWYMDEEFD